MYLSQTTVMHLLTQTMTRTQHEEMKKIKIKIRIKTLQKKQHAQINMKITPYLITFILLHTIFKNHSHVP